MSTILLIEPNTLLAAAYTQLLQHNGYDVVHVTGAQTAIDAADNCTPNLVVLELQLPSHGGIEFLHEFRSYAEWQGIPVIVNTVLPPAHIARAKQALVNEMGVRSVLYKPHTTLKELLRRVDEQLTFLT